jgi:hypothetical protein
MTRLTFSDLRKFNEFCQEFAGSIEYVDGTTAVLQELEGDWEMTELQESIEAEYDKYFTYTF